MTECSARPSSEADSRHGFGRTQLSFASCTCRGSGASRYTAGLRKRARNVLERSYPATVLRMSLHRRLVPARTLSGRGRHRSSFLGALHCLRFDRENRAARCRRVLLETHSQS
ncbi:hypothetical protein IscW_ISCW023411 [Ixodes scapularis]|uniref:Uncharacterized protein n=1 Tax=Ixodes scapularis TaxID=6945 RepID=B7QL85_IXOSC|nr:hypothetical protein IscW_ISCW023411 [Ixodes scapularis]|eukprot:XP_002415940.1 hypothetical protein IscW_ISCW023411 [Ixodes scapularis]